MSERENIKKDSQGVDSQFEVLGKLMVVHGGKLKENITSDYVMAHLNLDDQIYTKETYENAGFIKFIIEKIAEKSYKYKWDKEKEGYILNDDKQPKRIELNDDEKKYIKLNAEYLFNSLMIPLDILMILKRNNQTNHLLNILGNVKQIDESGNEVVDLDKDKEVIAKLKKKLRETND